MLLTVSCLYEVLPASKLLRAGSNTDGQDEGHIKQDEGLHHP